jgi:hypothetical protein
MLCQGRTVLPVAVGLLLTLAGRAAAVAPVIKDEGKFFSPEAVKKANEEIRAIYRRYNKDLLIETFPAAPNDQAEKVEAMSRDERSKYFERWARERAETEVVRGVYILVCKKPAHLQVEVSAKAGAGLDSPAVRKQLTDLLLSHLREKKFDEGLADAVKFVRNRLAEAR